jgi:hypothetical protein
MTTNADLPPDTLYSPGSMRWIGLLILSVSLHFFALQWTGLWPHFNQTYSVAPHIVKAELHASTTQTSDNQIRSSYDLEPSKVRPVGTAPAQRAVNVIPGASAMQSTSPPHVIESPSTLPIGFHLLPSSELTYDALSVKKGIASHGTSSIQWQSDGKQYSIIGTTEIGDMGVRTFESKGMIDQHGIAPEIYTEKSRKRSMTNTHFQRDNNVISFSASSTQYPRLGGEQDRASIIWQLAGMARGAPEKLKPNASFDIFVAGIRDGSVWHVDVIAEEDITTAAGNISAWHLVRLPRADSYDQKVDIWLAPQLGWYPVKLRYTQTNGDYVDMSLHTTNPVAPPTTR